LSLSRTLVRGLVALVAYVRSMTDDAFPSIPQLPSPVAVSPVERFLFGILTPTGVCVIWPVARKVTTLPMMAAVAVVGVMPAAVHGRWDLEGRHRFHDDKAADARFAAMNPVLELHGFQRTGTCLILVDPRVESDPSVQRLARLCAYHEALASKYTFAASHSWLPLSPDPPPPP
jgi:hypothetical protein